MAFSEEHQKLLIKEMPYIDKVTSKNVKYNDLEGLPVNVSIKRFIENFALKPLEGKAPDLVMSAVTNKEEYYKNFTALLVKIGRERDVREEIPVGESAKATRDILRELIPCVNILKPDEMILVRKDLRRSSYHPDLLRTLLLQEEEVIASNAIYAKFEYNPRKTEIMFTERVNKEVLQIINTYSPPEWMEMEINNPQIPEEIDKFMKHLFPIEEELEYVYDWLHKSLTDRAYVYLLLNGKKKTGKNTFKQLFKALHGRNNFVDGKKTLLTTQFNGQLSDCRALVFDEIRFSEDEENIMKEIQNDNVAIERKGMDATRGDVIHCSMVLMNNEAKDNFIPVDSRRIAAMQLTDKPLYESMSPKEVDSMLCKLREDMNTFDINYVAEFGHWILKNGRNERWGKEDDYKGPKFYELVQTSLSEWRRFTLKCIDEMIIAGNEYQYKLSEIEEKFYKKIGKSAKKFPDFGRVVSFISEYRDLSGNKIATTTKVDGERDYFIVLLNEEQKKESHDSEDMISSFFSKETDDDDDLR